MKHHILEKGNLDPFIRKLSKKMKVAAPVSKGCGAFAFEEVSSADNVVLDYVPTILPPKKYFMPQREKMLEFDISGNVPQDKAVLDCPELAVFGVHTCDLAGIQCLNMVFSERPRDYNYLRRKEKIFIVGLECNKYCDKYASCAFVGAHEPSGGYDLLLTDIGEKFVVYVNTQKGEEIAEGAGLPPASDKDMRALDVVREQKRSVFKSEVDADAAALPDILERSSGSKLWGDIGKKCVSCGNCTNVCPTCYCFDMADSINLDMKTGSRTRTWDSCQFETFAKVAGGENFRSERSERQRHRIHRKFKFPVDKFYRFFCTGCGRCSRTCMAGINMKETLNSLAKDD